MKTLVLLAATALLGCTQGATPDCSMVMCGPDLDGTVSGDGTVDAPAPDASDAAVDSAGDAPTDAPSDAPSDG